MFYNCSLKLLSEDREEVEDLDEDTDLEDFVSETSADYEDADADYASELSDLEEDYDEEDYENPEISEITE